MKAIKFSPEIRNMQIVSSILLNTYGADELTSYSIVANAVEEDIRTSKIIGIAPAEGETIDCVIMTMTSVLIRSGILICNTYDASRNRVRYGANTAIGLSIAMDNVLQMQGSFLTDQNEDYPYYGTSEADTLVEKMGNISFSVMNSANDTTKQDHLSFVFTGDATPANIAAAQELDHLFNSSVEVRQGMVRAAFQDGSIYLAREDADLGFLDRECAFTC